MRQFPERCPSNAELALFLALRARRERVRATRVGPHGGEGDFFVGAFLQQETAVGGAEEEDAECAVEEGFRAADVGHEVACLLASFPVGAVFRGDEDTSFFHQSDLFFVVCVERDGGVGGGGGAVERRQRGFRSESCHGGCHGGEDGEKDGEGMANKGKGEESISHMNVPYMLVPPHATDWLGKQRARSSK